MSASADYHRERRRDPVIAERDRESSRRWKAANRERNRARDRARHYDLRDPCPSCGTLKAHDAEKCRGCRETEWEERRFQIVAMYAAGVPLSEMAELLGTTVNSLSTTVCRLRQRGLIGYRNRGYGEAKV